MSLKYYMGIDPGKSGGVALVSEDGTNYYAFGMPATDHDILSRINSYNLIYGFPVFCMLERVHSHPKQGVASMFSFGQNYGFLRGVLAALAIPYDLVPPGTWQRKLQCLSGGDKNVTKAKAQRLFPNLKITHAIADALLIAEYCRVVRSNAG